MLQVSFIYFLSQTEKQPFLQGSLVPFSKKQYLETIIWMLYEIIYVF